MSSLKTVWCSRAAAKQRAGRAGRVRKGTCWRLYPRSWWGGEEVKVQEIKEEEEEAPAATTPADAKEGHIDRPTNQSRRRAVASVLPEYTVPEMQRTALEDLVMQVLLLESLGSLVEEPAER